MTYTYPYLFVSTEKYERKKRVNRKLRTVSVSTQAEKAGDVRRRLPTTNDIHPSQARSASEEEDDGRRTAIPVDDEEVAIPKPKQLSTGGRIKSEIMDGLQGIRNKDLVYGQILVSLYLLFQLTIQYSSSVVFTSMSRRLDLIWNKVGSCKHRSSSVLQPIQ